MSTKHRGRVRRDVAAARDVLHFDELCKHNNAPGKKLETGNKVQPLRWLEQRRRPIQEGDRDEVDDWTH